MFAVLAEAVTPPFTIHAAHPRAKLSCRFLSYPCHPPLDYSTTTTYLLSGHVGL